MLWDNTERKKKTLVENQKKEASCCIGYYLRPPLPLRPPPHLLVNMSIHLTITQDWHRGILIRSKGAISYTASSWIFTHMLAWYGARDGTWTRTVFLPGDFKSPYACQLRHSRIMHCFYFTNQHSRYKRYRTRIFILRCFHALLFSHRDDESEH